MRELQLKFIEPRPFADSDAAARRVTERASAVESVQDGRIHKNERPVPSPA